MEKFVGLIRRFEQLLEVKSIVTLLLVAVACYGFVTKMITAELFGGWVMAVITYFFTRQPKKGD
jgi:uncharacterized membrane-anchored protein